ncbi:TPA: hypothetical protein ACH3X1_015921 [Trebouxia sp. C0004]
MTANGAGGATSKTSQKVTRAAPAMADTEPKVKSAQQSRDPAEVAIMSSEDAVPTGTLKARGAAVHNGEWTAHEQAALDQAAVKFPAERYQPFERYVRIAATLPRKGVRDVAIRLRWLSQARKRKVSEDGPNKRLRRDRCQSIFATQQKPLNAMGQWPQQQLPMPQLDDHGAQTVGAVGGLVAQLLEQNLHILYQYKQNMHQFKVQENTELLVRFRDNILAVLNQMNSMDGVMSQMPQLPVRMNVELANNFLPAASGASPMFPLGMPGMPPGMGNMPSGPMPMNGYMGANAMGSAASMPMTSNGMPMPSNGMPMSSNGMPMSSNGMPPGSVPFTGQQQQQQHHSNGASPNAGGIVRAGPPPVTTIAAAAAGAAVASGPSQPKAPAQSASSSKGVAAKAPHKQPVVQNGRPAEQEPASTQPAPAAGQSAVASAVPAGRPAGSVDAQPTPAVSVASKPQSAASKSLAASASKVAAGMASKAASAKSNKQVKTRT